VVPPASARAQTGVQEVIAEIRIHGNYRTPDDEVVRIAGITVGSPLDPNAVEAAADRLRRSGRFESVDVRKRYRSLDDASQVAVIIAVAERPGVEKGGVMPGPMKRVRNALMASPSLEYVDGYGFIAGGRLSFVNVLGKGGHIVAPLTVGSTRGPASSSTRRSRAARWSACMAATPSSAARTPATTPATCETTSGWKALASLRAC